MGRNRRALGLILSLFMLLSLTGVHTATAHTKKWKTGVVARSPFPGEVFGAVNSPKAACRVEREVRLTHRDGVTGTRTPGGTATTPGDGSYSIAPEVDSVPGDTWVIKVARKVVRKSGKHRHVCKPGRATVPAADVTTIASADGSALLQIPEGAVDDAMLDEISVERVADPTTVPLRYRGAVEEFGDDPDPAVDDPPVASWEFEPAGLTFAEPARVTVTVDDLDGGFEALLLPGEEFGSEELQRVEVVGVSEGSDGATDIVLAIEHFSNLSLLPEGDPLTIEVPVPGQGAEFAVGEKFEWIVTTIMNVQVVHVRDVDYGGRFGGLTRVRMFRRASSSGWEMDAHHIQWFAAARGFKIVPARESFDPVILTDGTATCLKEGQGRFSMTPANNLFLSATVPHEIQYFRINPDGSTGDLLDDVGGGIPVTIGPIAPERSVECKGVTLSQHHPGGSIQSSSGGLAVAKDGQERIVTRGLDLYWGPFPGNSVILFNIYGPGVDSVPSSDPLDADAVQTIHDVFAAHVTEDPGGPTLDWPSVFADLGLNSDAVCGGRVVLDIEADQGGRVPGFDADGNLSGSGQYTGQAGNCQSFPITLTGQIP